MPFNAMILLLYYGLLGLMRSRKRRSYQKETILFICLALCVLNVIFFTIVFRSETTSKTYNNLVTLTYPTPESDQEWVEALER